MILLIAKSKKVVRKKVFRTFLKKITKQNYINHLFFGNFGLKISIFK